MPLAKILQAEVTRKAQGKGQQLDDGNKADDKGKRDDDEPAWFTKYKTSVDKKLDDLQKENDRLKAEKAHGERSAIISATAKKLGIPEFLTKRVTIAEDADIEKELTGLKQELINEKLMPAENADITSSSEQAAKDDAQSWAKTLPND